MAAPSFTLQHVFTVVLFFSTKVDVQNISFPLFHPFCRGMTGLFTLLFLSQFSLFFHTSYKGENEKALDEDSALNDDELLAALKRGRRGANYISFFTFFPSTALSLAI